MKRYLPKFSEDLNVKLPKGKWSKEEKYFVLSVNGNALKLFKNTDKIQSFMDKEYLAQYIGAEFIGNDVSITSFANNGDMIKKYKFENDKLKVV